MKTTGRSEWKCFKVGEIYSINRKVDSDSFWDSLGVVLIAYLGKGKTIKGVYYAAFVRQLNDAIKLKR